MTDKNPVSSEGSYEKRRDALIARGAVNRQAVDQSMDIVRRNLHLDRLAKNAVAHLSNAAYSKVETLFDWRDLSSGNLRKFLPLAATAYSIITRRKLLGPILRGTGITVAVSAAAFVWWRHNQKTKYDIQDDEMLLPSDGLANYPEYADAGDRSSSVTQYRQ
jgi:hypothetical protein